MRLLDPMLSVSPEIANYFDHGHQCFFPICVYGGIDILEGCMHTTSIGRGPS
jgi:hypothetical protein